MLATVYAVARDGAEVPVAPYSFWIDARTDGHLELPVPWLAAFSTNALAVRLQGATMHQRLEAPMPRPFAVLWFLGGALAVAALVAILSFLHPSVTRLDVPASVLAGANVGMTYATNGAGTRTWEIDDVHGGRIEDGSLAAASGSATIPAPRPVTQTAYTLRVATSGAFGSAEMSRPLIVVTPQPPVRPPRIISFSVDRAAIPDGGTLTARYRVSAQSGDVLAIDAQGNIIAQAAIHGADGAVRLTLPRFGRIKDLQLRLVVRRGAQLAAASVGVEVAAP